MGKIAKTTPARLQHSAFGSVALGVLVVGAGAVPGDWSLGGRTVAEPADQAVAAPAPASPVAPIIPASGETDAAVAVDWSQGLVVPVLTLPTRASAPAPVTTPTPTLAPTSAPPVPDPVEAGPRLAAVAAVPAGGGVNVPSNGTMVSESQPPETAPETALAVPPAPVAPAPEAPVARLALALPEVPPVTAQAIEIAAEPAPAAAPAPAPPPALAPAPAAPALLPGATRFDLARLPKAAPAKAAPARLAAPRAAPAQVAPARLANPRNRVPLRAPGGRYKVTPRGLEFDIAVVVSGVPGGRVPLLIDATDTLSVRLAEVLGAVRPLMDEATFARLSGSASAQEYVTFAKLRQVGIDLRYDAGGDRLVLSTGPGE